MSRMLSLTRPILCLDIEGTGLDVAKDRIISIAMTKLSGDWIEESRLLFLLNPGIPIPAESTEIHGFNDAIVAEYPSFNEHADTIHAYLQGCDLIAYNGRNYDIQILYAEFERCGIRWDLNGVHMIDPGAIFKKKEPRTLEAAVMFYCNRKMENAHNARQDVAETINVLIGQADRYSDILPMTVEQLSEYSKMDNRVDLAGKICKDKDGDYCWMIGNPRGRKVKDDISFGYWMLNKDFTRETKDCVERVLDEVKGIERIL